MTDNKPAAPLAVLLAHIEARYGSEAKQQAKKIYTAATSRYSRYSRMYAAEQRLADAENNNRFHFAETKLRIVFNFRKAAERTRAIWEAGELPLPPEEQSQ